MHALTLLDAWKSRRRQGTIQESRQNNLLVGYIKARILKRGIELTNLTRLEFEAPWSDNGDIELAQL